MRVQTLKYSKNREHSNSGYLWKLNSNSWKIQSVRDHILFGPQAIPYLSQYIRHLVFRIRRCKAACWLYYSLHLPFLVQKLHSTWLRHLVSRRKSVFFGQKNISWTTGLSSCLVSMDPVWGWISFNSVLGQAMRNRHFSLSGHAASCCEGFSTANKVDVRCDCQIKCRNKYYILEKCRHPKQAAK